MKRLATLASALALLIATSASAQLMQVKLVSDDLISEANYNPYDGHNLQPAAGTLTLETFFFLGKFGDLTSEPWNRWHLYGDVERLGSFDLNGRFDTTFWAEPAGSGSSWLFQADTDECQFFGTLYVPSDLSASDQVDGFVDLRLWLHGDDRAQTMSATITLTPVPEPASYGAIAGCVLLLGLIVRRYRTLHSNPPRMARMAADGSA